MKAKNNIQTLDQFKTKHYGEIGTEKRDQLDAGFKNFKIGAMIHDARNSKRLDTGRTCRESRNYKIIYFKN